MTKHQQQTPSAWLPAHVFIIAEAGVNHNGDMQLARQLIDAAAEAGADAVKFQTFKAERLASAQTPKCEYQKRASGPSESQLDMLRRLELPQAQHKTLMQHCRKRGIQFLSTPFEEESAKFLHKLGVPLFKIPSGEITNLPYLEYVARFGRPMIVSTGMSSLGEVEAAVHAIQTAGNQNIALLHCVSNYPAGPENVNLRAMHTMQQAFGLPVGYSDHTMGLEVALAAVALGAQIIEKHFTLDRNLTGPDHAASLEPNELKALVYGIRSIELALGNGLKVARSSESDTLAVIRKSLVAKRRIPAGKLLTSDMIAIRRPGTGLAPALRPYVIGRKAKDDIPAGEVIRLEMLQ